jgi:GYF domain 2
MAEGRWFIARNKEKVGPFTPADLKQLATFGLLGPGEYIWTDGASKWVEAASLPGLFPRAGQKKYWLALGGQMRGPYVGDQIKAALNTGQLQLDILACAEGGDQWQALGQQAEFASFVPAALNPSRAQLLTGTLDMEEAVLHLAGKGGDMLARLISTLMDLKRAYTHNTALVESLEQSIQALQKKRQEMEGERQA